MSGALILLSLKSLFEPILIGLLFATLMGAAAAILEKPDNINDVIRRAGWALSYYVMFGIPISLLAYVTGYLTSLSRTAVVGSVLPAVLALIGGVNIYVFGTNTTHKVVVGFCVALFTTTLFYGVQRGALEREAGREARLITLSEQEWRIRNYRLFRKLPDDFPAWIVSGEPK